MFKRTAPNGFTCRSCRQRLTRRSSVPSIQRRRISSTTARASKPSPSTTSFRSLKDFKYIPQIPARTRFAPSPTGHLHLGSLRTALYSYLIARRTGGKFILRIEDTDGRRTVSGAESRILADLQWAGINWDEGPDNGGPYGPYRQSERVQLYRAAAEELIVKGSAYRCFCSAEKLKEKARGRDTGFAGSEGYDRSCYHIPKENIERMALEGRPYVVRLLEPEKMASVVDLTYGRVRTPGQTIARGLWQDPILLKTNGVPTYHLASVVDDHYMKISHVIRGVEWLISTRWHLELYRAFGWEPPTYAHVGLLLNEEGHKLSKREQSIDIGMMKEEGVLPEALCNFVALLGWNHGPDTDFMPMRKMEEVFTLKFNTHNPMVSLRKLRYLSPRHAEARVSEGGAKFEELVQLVMEAAKRQYPAEHRAAVGLESDDKLQEACRWVLTSNAKNFTSVSAFVESQPYFFSDRPNVVAQPSYRPDYFVRIMDEAGMDEQSIRTKTLEYLFPTNGKDLFCGTVEDLRAQVDALMDDFARLLERSETAASQIQGGQRQKIVQALIYPYLRGWITWGAHGPPLVEIMLRLGPDVVRKRIENVKIAWKSKAQDEEPTRRNEPENDATQASAAQAVQPRAAAVA